MATPKYKKSKSKTRMRRAHQALRAPAMCYCANCNEVKVHHVACTSCGHLKGEQVIEPKRMGGDFGEDFNVEG